MRLILASQSRARRAMLDAAGLSFELRPSGVDEAAALAGLRAEPIGLTPGGIAEHLAVVKAEAVSRLYPEAIVIGADQVLALGDDLLEKPVDLADARRSLARLRGREHALHSAVAVAVGGVATWRHDDTARLMMRAFSDQFLDDYVAAAGEPILDAVGGYELEGRGIQLFERIEGDYFTILGMPLLPLLETLRRRGAIPS